MAYSTKCEFDFKTEKKSIGGVSRRQPSCKAFHKGPTPTPEGYCDNCPIIAALKAPHCIYLRPAWVDLKQEGYSCKNKHIFLGKHWEQCFNDPGTCDDYVGE